MSIRIGIMGYGNLGRGVECAVKHNPDLELAAVFTRRDPETVKILTETAKVCHVDEAEKMKDEIDVLIICGGSATDLPVQTPKYALMSWKNYSCSMQPAVLLLLLQLPVLLLLPAVSSALLPPPYAQLLRSADPDQTPLPA